MSVFDSLVIKLLTFLVSMSGRKSRFAKNIRKEIMKVRLQLSKQKKRMEREDAKSNDNASGKSSHNTTQILSLEKG